MRGQLYRGHADATALSSGPVVSALGSESDDPGSSPGRGKALLRRAGKKRLLAPLLGLAKSIYCKRWLLYIPSEHRYACSTQMARFHPSCTADNII